MMFFSISLYFTQITNQACFLDPSYFLAFGQATNIHESFSLPPQGFNTTAIPLMFSIAGCILSSYCLIFSNTTSVSFTIIYLIADHSESWIPFTYIKNHSFCIKINFYELTSKIKTTVKSSLLYF